MVVVPLRYNLRSLLRRRLALFMTVVGVAAVVAIFVAMMAIANGLRGALSDSGDARNVIVTRRGTLVETMSVVDHESFAILRDLPEVARDAQGRPLASPEVVTVWSVSDVDGKDRQIPMRGVTDVAYGVRQIEITAGRKPEAGKGEAMVGSALAGRIQGLSLGGRFRWGRREWRVVGVFEARGSAFESEVWGDVDGVLADDDRAQFSSVAMRATSASSVPSLAARIDGDRRFSLHAQRETDYYRVQAGSAAPARAAALTMALLMGIAAVFGALNTMQASLAGRSREIAVLRALGFGRLAIGLGFVVEALMLTIPAGALGCALAMSIHGHSMSMTNIFSFTSVAFRFRVTPDVIASGMLFAVAIGVLGGAWPAFVATRGSLTDGLRS